MARSQMQMAQTRRLYNYGLPLLRHKQCFGCCWQYLKSKLLIIKIFLHSYLYDKNYIMQEAWEWHVEDYKMAFENEKRLSPEDYRKGHCLYHR